MFEFHCERRNGLFNVHLANLWVGTFEKAQTFQPQHYALLFAGSLKTSHLSAKF
jgi:hypothetical protein